MNDMVKSQSTAAAKPQKSFSLNPTTMEEACKMAEMMANSDLVPQVYRNKPGNVLIAVQMGAEVGLSAMQSVQNIAVINGNPSIWGDAVPALVKAHPKYEYMKESLDKDSLTAYCTMKRKGEEEHTVAFSWEDAQRAGLTNKDPWKKYPQRMLQMRARSWCARDVFPDALKGLAVAEEAMDIPPRDMGAAHVVTGEEPPVGGADAINSKLRGQTEPAAKPAEPEPQKPAEPRDKNPESDTDQWAEEYDAAPGPGTQSEKKPAEEKAPPAQSEPDPGFTPLQAGQIRVIEAKCQASKVQKTTVLEHFGADDWTSIPNTKVNDVLAFITKGA